MCSIPAAAHADLHAIPPPAMHVQVLLRRQHTWCFEYGVCGGDMAVNLGKSYVNHLLIEKRGAHLNASGISSFPVHQPTSSPTHQRANPTDRIYQRGYFLCRSSTERAA